MSTTNMDLLRFATAGSVDDGKSTLIGRLLLDSKSIFEDQLEAVESTSQSKGYDYTDLALLTDGLRSEREQGITIDVAYRYFATPARKARRSTLPCWSTDLPPSASKASPSTWPTATSRRPSASSSSRTLPGTFSTPATWSPAPRPPTSAWSSWTPVRV